MDCIGFIYWIKKVPSSVGVSAIVCETFCQDSYSMPTVPDLVKDTVTFGVGSCPCYDILSNSKM